MKEIPLTQGKVALVDDEDYAIVLRWKWCLSRGQGGLKYAIHSIRANGHLTTIPMHRVILRLYQGRVCDHINGDGLDNRKANLRLCTQQQNTYNQRARRVSATGYKGPYLHKGGLWKSSITVNGKTKYLGYWQTARQAALIYDAAARQYFGEFARLNFPEVTP